MDIFGIGKAVFGDKGLVGSVTDVLKGAGVLKDPEQELKVMKALQDFEVRMVEEESKRIESINATMREEAKSEHWAQWLWRPTIGFTFAATIINNYILVPYARSFGLDVPNIEIPDNVWIAILTVLGAAAYTRGTEKTAKASK